jgi:hypothetical protein
MGIFTYRPVRSKIYRYNTRESRPPWAGLCNKTTHATAIGVETGFYNVFINIRPPRGRFYWMINMVLGVPAFAGMTRVIGKEEEVPAFAGMTISGVV